MLRYFRAFFVYLDLIIIFFITYMLMRIVNLYSNVVKLDNDIRLRYCSNIYTFVSYYMLKLLFWIKIEVDGNNDLKQNMLITCNHINYLDANILANLYNKLDFTKLHVFADSVLFDIPFLGYVFKSLEYIPVKFTSRSYEEKNKISNADEMYKLAEKYLSKGHSVFMFFEGRRNINPKELNKIQYGLYNIADRMKNQNQPIPIKFIGIRGIYKIWNTFKHPTGTGKVEIKIFDQAHHFTTSDDYVTKIHELYDEWIKKQHLY
jgi:1-acyl-sn-glycerol-3-phosphate acyltransferase